MEKSLNGRIVKGVGGIFKVASPVGMLKCSARGILKRGDEKLFVGDYVKLRQEKGVWYISELLPRKNLLVRPYVSNVDMLVIVIAPLPEVDYVLVDKLLLFCAEYKIKPIICINKSELGGNTAAYTRKVYGELCGIFEASAFTGEGIAELFTSLKGTVCFAGQSAVGKTSLLNAFSGLQLETGGLSKIQRGRNTTRHIEIYRVSPELDIMDTCGFSLLSPEGFDENMLALYYPDFVEQGACRFSTCTHISEPDCAVKKAVEQGRVDEGRYQRYLSIFAELAELNRRLI